MTATLRDSAAAFALGAVDDVTRAAFERAMPNDADLVREVASFAPVVALLSLAAPAVAPPASLRARVLAGAAAVRPIGAERTAAPRRAAPQVAARSLPWLALAASLGAIVVLGQRLSDARQEALALAASVESLEARTASADSLLATMLAPEVETVRLVSSGAPPGARMYVNARSARVILAAWQLPPAARGRTYQLWGIPKGGVPVSLGTFVTSASGEVRAAFVVPAGLRINVGAVTEEPEGGSPQPTTTPFLVGQIAGAP